MTGCAVDRGIERAGEEERTPFLLGREGCQVAADVAIPGGVGEDEASLKGGQRFDQPAQGDGFLGRLPAVAEGLSKEVHIVGAGTQPIQQHRADGLGGQSAQGGAGHLVQAGHGKERLRGQRIVHVQIVDGAFQRLDRGRGSIADAVQRIALDASIPKLARQRARC